MRTWNVTWSCENCCGIFFRIQVKTMTNRESSKENIIAMARQKMFDIGIGGDWFCFDPVMSAEHGPMIMEVSNASY